MLKPGDENQILPLGGFPMTVICPQSQIFSFPVNRKWSSHNVTKGPKSH